MCGRRKSTGYQTEVPLGNSTANFCTTIRRKRILWNASPHIRRRLCSSARPGTTIKKYREKKIREPVLAELTLEDSSILTNYRKNLSKF